MDLANPGTPETWADVVPQHDKDLLQWAAALKVPAKSPLIKLFIILRIIIPRILHILQGLCILPESGLLGIG